MIFRFDELKKFGDEISIVSEDLFTDARGSVPPINGKGFWAMGEIADHTPEGIPQYFCFARYGADYFGYFGTLESAENAFLPVRGRFLFTTAKNGVFKNISERWTAFKVKNSTDKSINFTYIGNFRTIKLFLNDDNTLLIETISVRMDKTEKILIETPAQLETVLETLV